MTNPKEALEWYERKQAEARAMADRDCKNCKYHKADGCSRWDCEYEPAKSDLIRRQDAIEAVATVTMSIHLSNVLCDKLLALPSAEPKTGEWIGEGDGYSDGEMVYDTWYCSECDWCIEEDDQDALPNYCPNCGAYMKGENK